MLSFLVSSLARVLSILGILSLLVLGFYYLFDRSAELSYSLYGYFAILFFLLVLAHFLEQFLTPTLRIFFTIVGFFFVLFLVYFLFFYVGPLGGGGHTKDLA